MQTKSLSAAPASTRAVSALSFGEVSKDASAQSAPDVYFYTGPFGRSSLSTIVGLFFSCGPLAVVLSVWAVVVDAVKGMIFGRSWSDISNERGEVLPIVAYRNPSGTVLLKVRAVDVGASLQHAAPNHVHVVQWVAASGRASLLMNNRTARPSKTSFQATPENGHFGTAVTATQPRSVAVPSCAIASVERHNSKSSESMSCDVLKRVVSWQWGRIIAGHAGLHRRSAVLGWGGRFQRSLQPLVIAVFYLVFVLPVTSFAQQTVVGEDLYILDDSDFLGDVGHPDYVSQLNYWKITPDGSADFRYLFTDELRAKLFTADMEAVLAGSQRVTKSFSLISQPFTCPAASGTSTLWVQDAPTYGDAAVFVSGDAVIIRNLSRTSFGPFSISDCVGVVTSYTDGTGADAGQQSWTFTRNAGGDAGAMTASTVVPVDTLVQDLGVSGNGYVETTAVDGAAGINAPYTQIVTWTTAPVAANLSTRARLGNLRGITGSTEYGLLAGTYAATGGQYFKASDLGFELHGINLQMWDGSTNVIKLDRTVPSFAIGTPIPSGYLTGGDGFWVGKDSGVYKLRIGDPTGNRMTFASGVLTIIGDGGGVTNINGGNIQTDTITATQIAANAITTSELNADSVTSAKIVAGTIVASDIATSTITADRMNVSTLSAITANLGTVTAGTIDGVTIRAGSGDEVTLDASGITLQDGTAGENKIKWDDSSEVFSVAGWLTLNGDVKVAIRSLTGNALYVEAGIFYPQNTNSSDLGTSSLRFRDLYLTEAIYFSSLDTTTSNDYPIVFSTGGGRIYRKTNGFDGTCSSPTSIVIERGIVVSCS